MLPFVYKSPSILPIPSSLPTMKGTKTIRGVRPDQWLLNAIVREMDLSRRFFIHGWAKTMEHPAFSSHLYNLSFYLAEVNDPIIRANVERRLQKALLEEAARNRMPHRYPYVRLPKLVLRNDIYRIVLCTPELYGSLDTLRG